MGGEDEEVEQSGNGYSKRVDVVAKGVPTMREGECRARVVDIGDFLEEVGIEGESVI